MKIFGDENTFAISYRQDDREATGNYAFPYCHFIFNKQLIGYKDENCFLGTWATSLLYKKNQILQKEGYLTEPEFKDLSDLEIFESLIKANQSEDNFKRKYHYLPKLVDDVWYKYRVDMDETIDGFTIFILEDNKMLKFLWKNHARKNTKFGVMRTTHEQFYQTVDSCLLFLTKQYPTVIGNLI